jgi:pimeloyl-ACP methyl ester carboxylesterase
LASTLSDTSRQIRRNHHNLPNDRELAGESADEGDFVRKLVMITAAASVGLTGLSVAAPAGAASSSAGAKIAWGQCAYDGNDDPMKNAECAQLPVPLDYKHPHGKKISIAISRLKHTGPASKYQGVLIANPGGPGGSGLYLAGSLPNWLAGVGHPEVAANYDVIGFDPRGVGSSKPALTCDPSYSDPIRPDYVPGSKKAELAWLAKSKKYAQACAKKFGWLLPHLRTTDAARDLDSIRVALGQKKINYYGFSYGTYLGATYGSLFPKNVRRMILDGNVGPSKVWYDAQLEQDKAFERNFKLYTGWIAKYDAVYHLGTTAAAVEKAYYKIRAQAKKTPLGGKVGPDELDDTVLNTGYSTGWYKPIAGALSQIATTGKADQIVYYYENYIKSTDDNGFAMYNAVQSVDAKWPRNWTKWHNDAVKLYPKARFNTWSNVWFNAPAAFWAAPGGPAFKIHAKGLAPFLMVQSTLDAATPYAGGLELHKLLPSSRLVAEIGGKTHANTLNGNLCLDDKVAAYLNTGALPKAKPGNGPDTTCAALPDPDPTVTAAARSQTGSKRDLTVLGRP